MRKLCVVTAAAVVSIVMTAVLAGIPGSREPASAGLPTGVILSIDANPGNGTRPCDPIDPTSSVALSTSHSVAVCLDNYLQTQGSPNAFDARVQYSAINIAPEAPDVAPALNDNPNANDGAGPNSLGPGWDCTAFGQSFPKGDNPNTAGVLDATIFCNGATLELTAEPGLLATIDFQSTSTSGTDILSFLAGTNIYAFDCGTVDLTCTGATITKGAGGTAPTATSTSTPGSVTPTNTKGPGGTATPTPTPPGAGGETPPPSGTTEPPPPPPPGGGTAPTTTGGGTGAGGVRPPSTGSGGESSMVSTQGLLIALMAVVGGAAVTGAGWRMRRGKRQ
ncbi:MAG: hypothetical protein WEB52_05260 [Dehalococcoidia bacterium]